MKRPWVKILVLVLIGLGLLVSLPVYRHLRLKRAVAAYWQELRAKGEKISIEELVPRPGTNGPNGAPEFLAAARQLGSLPYSLYPSSMRVLSPGHARISWNRAVLATSESTNIWPDLKAALQGKEQLLGNLRAALKMPEFQFQLNYQNFDFFPHLPAMKETTQKLSAWVMLQLHEGQGQAAMENLVTELDLVRAWKDEPTLISQLVRIAMLRISWGNTWEALHYPRLEERDLAELQKGWMAVESLGAAEKAMEMERHLVSQICAGFRDSYDAYTGARYGLSSMLGGGTPGTSESVDFGRNLISKPFNLLTKLKQRWFDYLLWKWWWSYEEELCDLQTWQAALQELREARKGKAFVKALSDFDRFVGELDKKHPHKGNRFILYGTSAAGIFLDKILSSEVHRELLVTAIALQRFHLRHGKYPAQLSELQPEFLDRIPIDPMDGEPLRYRIQTDGTYLLYSVGQNGVDDGGSLIEITSPRTREKLWRGRDWVWPSIATPEEIAADDAKLNAPKRGKSR